MRRAGYRPIDYTLAEEWVERTQAFLQSPASFVYFNQRYADGKA